MKLVKRNPPIFDHLVDLLVSKTYVVGSNLGYRVVEPTVRKRAPGQLKKVLAAQDPVEALGWSMTSLMVNVAYREIDKADPLVVRYALEFFNENRLLFAEVKLLEGQQDGD